MERSQIPITGVVADFHQQSLHAPFKPLAITSLYERQLTFNIALQADGKGGIIEDALAKIEKAFSQVYPNDDFEYYFQDQTIEKYYRSEQNISRLLV